MNQPAARFDLDEIRRRVSLVDLVGRVVKLRRAGRGWSGLCPFHKEKTASFTVTDEKGFYHCFGCGAHGDLFAWVVETQGVTFVEAAAQLAAGAAIAPTQEIKQRESNRRAVHDVVGSATVGRFIWATASPARGEIVEAYLRSRELDPEGIPGALDRVRYHPHCPAVPWRVHEHAMDAWVKAPAMVWPICDAGGAVWGVHTTYLAPDGKGKASLPRTRDGKPRPSRKMWGRYAGLAVHLTELSGPDAPPGPLVAGEGIETVWAYVQGSGGCQRQPGWYRAAATLSLENLQGRERKLRDGSSPLWRPELDPGRTMFTLPDAGDVILLIDADMKPLKDQKLQLERGGKPVRGDISPIERAQLCAALATQAWRNAGAGKVTAVRPPMGMDFNDVAMEDASASSPQPAVRGTAGQSVGVAA